MKNQKKNAKNPGWILPVGIAAVIVIVAAILLTNRGNNEGSLPSTVSVNGAAERFNNGAFLLDVREPSEWESGHVPGAVLIPLGEVQSRMNEIPTDQDVLIICRSGNRSGQARDMLRAAGLSRTTSVTGGMNAWAAAGLPVVTGP